MTYTTAAYLLSGVLLFGYALSIWWRRRDAERTLAAWSELDEPEPDAGPEASPASAPDGR